MSVCRVDLMIAVPITHTAVSVSEFRALIALHDSTDVISLKLSTNYDIAMGQIAAHFNLSAQKLYYFVNPRVLQSRVKLDSASEFEIFRPFAVAGAILYVQPPESSLAPEASTNPVTQKQRLVLVLVWCRNRATVFRHSPSTRIYLMKMDRSLSVKSL